MPRIERSKTRADVKSEQERPPDWVYVWASGHPLHCRVVDRNVQAIVLHPRQGDHDIRTLRERALVASGMPWWFSIDGEEYLAETYCLSL